MRAVAEIWASLPHSRTAAPHLKAPSSWLFRETSDRYLQSSLLQLLPASGMMVIFSLPSYSFLVFLALSHIPSSLRGFALVCLTFDSLCHLAVLTVPSGALWIFQALHTLPAAHVLKQQLSSSRWMPSVTPLLLPLRQTLALPGTTRWWSEV